MDWGTLAFLGLVLACPLMHLLMHRGGGHAGHGGSDAARPGGDPIAALSDERLLELRALAREEIAQRERYPHAHH